MVRDERFNRISEGGYVGHMLNYCLGKTDSFYEVRVDLRTERFGTGAHFVSKGNFRQDAIDAARRLIEHYAENLKDTTPPADWERKVLDTDDMLYKLEGEGVVIGIGAHDLKRIAEIAKDGYVKNPRKDGEGNQVLDRDEFLTEFRGAYADRLLNWTNSCFSSAWEVPQPPNEEELAEILEKAGQLHDSYVAMPVGSLLVTKDHVFPYLIGRKKHQELRWPSDRYCGYREKTGVYIPTADPNVYLTGIYTGFASHNMKNPVFNASFGFPMKVVNTTFIVPSNEENNYVGEAIESMGEFNTVWIQCPPRNIPTDITQPRGNNWNPTKHELIRVINTHLEIAG
ncbi:MAG: hypothetical protein HY513_00330 [Candidatus Aenigmarchaeota archaeon]|nr:hypothetical protein [Candidatus Aenigmarchaeota archaeon]